MPETNEIKADVTAETTPRGDLIDRLVTLVRDETQAKIVVMNDPLTGAQAPLLVARDSEGNQDVSAISAAIFADYLPNPRDRRGTANLTSLDSFITHTNRFKDDDTVIFACDDRTKPSFTAVLDYSPGGLIETRGDGTPVNFPRFHRHKSHFAFPLSDEWKAWNAANGKDKAMSMPDFALFLEDRIADVAYPGEYPLSAAAEKFIKLIGGTDLIASPEDLIALSRSLRINEEVRVVNASSLSSGEGEISFASEHLDETGAKLRVPTSFQIIIPVFRNGPAYAVIARLRYRRNNGTVVFWYELWRTDMIFDHAFEESVGRVATETELTVLRGSPEA